jgi:hypothetical protein
MIIHTNTPPACQFPRYAEVQELLLNTITTLIRQIVSEAMIPLEQELQLIKSLQNDWVNTKEAMRITGIKQAETLKAERERPSTLIVVKFEGTTGKMPLYLLTSLLAYNDSRIYRHHTGRNLNE